MSELDNEKIKRLDGSLLLVFLELVRHQRTTTVAKRLGLSQSAVSHALARLRDLFGDRLFIRRPNGLEPTQRALELLPRVEQLLQLANDTLQGGQPFEPATSRRHFRIGAPDYVCTVLAAPLLQRFEREADQARFSFRLLVGRDAIDGLRRDEIDLAIGRFPAELQDYAVEPLFDEAYCVIARRGHPRLSGAIDLPTYAALGHVLVSISGDFVGLNDRVMRALRVERRMVASVPRFLIALSVVAETDAVATVPRRLALRHAEQLGLQVLSLPFELESFSIAAVAREPSDPAIEWLTAHLRDCSR